MIKKCRAINFVKVMEILNEIVDNINKFVYNMDEVN